MRGRPRTPEQHAAVLALRREGLTAAAIAARLGIAGSAVVRTPGWSFIPGPVQVRAEAARRARAKRRQAAARRARGRATRAETIRALRAQGWPIAALARRFRVSESVISETCSGAILRPGSAGDGPDLPALDVPRPADEACYVPPRRPPGTARRRGEWPYSGAPAVGSENGRAKLTEAKVREMRRLRAEDPKRWTYPALAERYGVSRLNVGHVLAGRTWKHVAEAPIRPADAAS